MKIAPSIAHLVDAWRERDPDRAVLTFEYEGREETRSYAQLADNGQRLAAALAARGLRDSERVGLLLYNHPEFVELMVASAILGVVLVPIDARARGDSLVYMLRNADCRGVVCGDYALAHLLDAAPVLPGLRWAMVLGDGVPAGSSALPLFAVRDALAQPVTRRAILVQNPATAMQIMYTSGTTGNPKGILIPHGRFTTMGVLGMDIFGYRPDDRPYSGLSLTHGNAQFVSLAPSLTYGLHMVISRKFTKSRLWDIVRRHGCTTFALLGGMTTALYAEPVRENDADNPVRLVISAGMPGAIWSAFAQRYGVAVYEFYAAMEGGGLFNPPGQGPIGSCGRCPPQQRARIVDEDDREVPRGTAGELCFQATDGPPIKVEYLNDPEASARKTRDGWLRTGDIASMDENGWIYFHHRAGGGIRRNGEFLNPALVEKVIAESGDVVDVFVYGRATPESAPGERELVAAIVPLDPVRFDPQTIIQRCAAKLPPNAVPRFVQPVTEIPKTASEKPQERFLLAMFDAQPDIVFDAAGDAALVLGTDMTHLHGQRSDNKLHG
jgi:carnitine-CoA ligase